MPASILYPNTQPDDPALQSVWQVQEAKNRFSELIEAALAQGPQVVTRHGKPVVKIVPLNDDGQVLVPPLARGPQTAFGKHFMSLLDLPPGPDLELPERRRRSSDASIFD